MKAIIKNILKSLCYVLLFLGIQILVNFVVQFGYGFKAGMEAGKSGVPLDAEAFAQELQVYLLENQNLILLASSVVTLLFLWIFFKCRHKKLTQEAQIRKFDIKMILPMIVMGCSLSLFISSVLCILPLPENLVSSYDESSQGLLGQNLMIRILSVMIMAPVVEEIIFRGLIFSRLKRGMKTPIAIIISSFLFALMHGQLIWIIYTFVVGLIFAIVFEKTKSLGTSILCHMAFNSVSVLAGGISVTGTGVYIMILVTFVLMTASMIFILKSNNFERKNKIKFEVD
ncbi:MAG: CPBP family intramembrane metalloprotease [Lachnospiraceae bacterium]|nr:CPBP family intramembrane metalloprotease [Lachnospiraceae bacterium]